MIHRRVYRIGCLAAVFGMLNVLGRMRADDKSLRINEKAEREIASAQATFLKRPVGAEAALVRGRIARSIPLDDPEASLAILRKLQQPDAEHGDGLDLAYIAVAQAFFEQKHIDRCNEMLQDVVRRYPKSTATSRAMLMLAEVSAANGDAKKSREWLQRCVDFELTEETGRGLMDTDNTRSVAFQRLAAVYEKEGDFVNAFKMWQAWQPRSWCGNCLIDMYRQRSTRMVECLSRVKDHRLVVRICLEDALNGDGYCARSRLVAMYQDAGQLDDLANLIDELERRELQKVTAKTAGKVNRSELTSAYLRLAVKAERLRQRRDVSGLVAICADPSTPFGMKVHSAALLAEFGDQAVKPIEEALVRVPTEERRWLVDSLSDNSSHRAFQAIVRFAEGNTSFSHEWLLINSIAQRPREARAVMERLLKHPNKERAEAAKEKLQELQEIAESTKPEPRSIPDTEPTASQDRTKSIPLPKPAAGSLPKSWNWTAKSRD